MFRFFVLKLMFLATIMLNFGAVHAVTPLSVELSAETSRPAPNDLIQAVMSTEAGGATPGELSKQINPIIAEALKVAKAYPYVKVKSGNTSTLPVYTKNGKIESWRMRSEILLESNDPENLSELLGKLQSSLGISSLTMAPSPETRKKAEDEATLDAIALFKSRAQLLAENFGNSYSIIQLSVSNSGRLIPPMARMAPKVISFSSESMPMEIGESLVTVTVAGKISVE